MTNNILRLWKSLDSDDPLEPFFKAAPIMCHSIDRHGVLQNVSLFWAEKLGYRVEEMVGHKVVEFLSEKSRVHAQQVAMPQVINKGQVYNVEYDFLRKDGTVLPVLLSALSQYDANGAHVRSLAVVFDNSETKAAQAALQRKQRYEALGALVGGVAHDFNNLLAVIQGNLELLLTDLDHPDRVAFIEDAIESTRKGSVLTRQLLTYGSKAHLSPQIINVNDVVYRVDRLVRRLFPKNVEFKTITPGDLWKVQVDVVQLETALFNILNNAKDAMPNGGCITVRTRHMSFDGNHVELGDELVKPGRYVMLSVTDNGMGMDDDMHAKAFDPYFTTKPVGQGSGLGLAMVFGFVRQSNGFLRSYSQPGLGTTFELYFPAICDDEWAVDRSLDGNACSERGQLILAVEDNKNLCKRLTDQLTREGYRVEAKDSAASALAALQAGLVPDLLITKVIMPGSVQGPELVERVREFQSGVKAIFLTDFPTQVTIHGNNVRKTDRELFIPVSRTDLLKAVQELIGLGRVREKA